jgi:hypothetical protein
MRIRVLAAASLVVAACSDPPAPLPAPGAAPLFPADYAASYVEVRDCRKSGDHELAFVRVLADEAALGPYQDRDGDFPEGAVLLKEQYDFGDATCSGPIGEFTLMAKRASATDRLGWEWQRVGADRRVVESNGSRCVTCHARCTGAPEIGYDFTCTEPP